MRLGKIQEYLKQRDQAFTYTEEDGCGSIDFDYRGVPYHIWEYCDDDGTRGVETNVRNGGSSEDVQGSYEEGVIDIIKNWQG